MRRVWGIAVAAVLAGCAPTPPAEIRPAPPRRRAFGDGESRCTGLAEVPRPVTVAADGRALAYVSLDLEGNCDLWRKGEGAAVALTSDAGDERDPAFSPDGREIAFSSNRSGSYDLYILPAAGGAWRQITTGHGDERRPSWSPDGRRLAFDVGGDSIWIVDLETLALTHVGPGRAPAWSPDGSSLAFTLRSVWTCGLDGSTRRNLTPDRVAHNLSWSPDSRWIVFDGPSDDLWAAARDGSRVLRITWDPSNDWAPTWCSDGSIWFASLQRTGVEAWCVPPQNGELLK